MPNNVESNFREKVGPAFLEEFDSSRVFSKSVNTQLLENKFDGESGETTAFKRPADYVAIETDDGDLTGEAPSPIIIGNAIGRVQKQITVLVEYQAIDQALKLGNLNEILKPAAKRLSTKLETNFSSFMMRNTGLLSGTVGTAANTWDHIARFGAIMEATGVPMDGMWNCAVNPFAQVGLADNQRSLGAGGSAGSLVKSAHESAMIAENYAGMRVMTATTQGNYVSGAGAARAGTLSANPDVTYVAAKDTMQQVLSLAGFEANLEIKAGEQIQIAGRHRLNLSTRDIVLTDSGQRIEWTGTVLNDVTLSGTGTGLVTISGPAIFETGPGNGAFNTVDSAPISGDVVTLLGAASTIHQPNLFWNKNAFSIGSVNLQKLNAQQNTATTEDGIRIRITRGSDFLKDKNMVRFDILPAFLAANPLMAGQGFGF